MGILSDYPGTSYWALSGAKRDTIDNFGMSDAPKLKFNFTVQFIPRSDIKFQNVGNLDMDKISFGCKTATRPKPTIKYEDINFYNFRTQVGVSLEQGTAALSFYDDVNNNAHSILDSYLTAVSPVSSTTQAQAGDMDQNGQSSTSSLGALTDNRHGPIAAIQVAHYYFKGHPKKVTYIYLNPKFTALEYDDLDMSASEANMVNMTFNYDSVQIIKE